MSKYGCGFWSINGVRAAARRHHHDPLENRRACGYLHLQTGEVTMFDRVTFDPKSMGGRACIRGMRVPVSVIVSEDRIVLTSDLDFGEIAAALKDKAGNEGKTTWRPPSGSGSKSASKRWVGIG
jgi:uncharacterized protein (DUF433 family)